MDTKIDITAELLNKLFDQVPGMIYVFKRKLDGEYCVPFTTENIKVFFGCSAEDVADSFEPIKKIILPEDIEKVMNSIKESGEKLTKWKCEYRVQLPGEKIKWLFANSIPEKQQDGTVLWYGFNTDITEQKEREEDTLTANAELKKMNDLMVGRELKMSELKMEIEELKIK